MEQQRELLPGEYSPGHPWYYVLGGMPLFPKQILKRVKESGCRGYRQNDIERAAGQAEPDRSIALRKLRDQSRRTLFTDLARYRTVASQLRSRRESSTGERLDCDDIYLLAALKYNHIYNELSHLIWLNELLSEQRDLFDV